MNKTCFERTIYYPYDEENPTQTTRYCIKDECNPFKSDWKFGSHIGQGDFGVVYNVKIKGVEHVAKAIPLNVVIPSEDCNFMNRHLGNDCATTEKEEFELEAIIAKKAGEIGVCPKIAGSFICEETLQITERDQVKISMGVIVMKKIDMTLEDYAERYPINFNDNLDKIYKLVKEKAFKLGEIGYALSDTHLGNIMINIDRYRDVVDLFFIDFGDAYETENGYNNTFKNFEETMEKFFYYN